MKFNLTIDNAGRLCKLCQSCNYDINVMSGRVCVDGKSEIGVISMSGRIVDVIPVTYDNFEVMEFERKLDTLKKELENETN